MRLAQPVRSVASRVSRSRSLASWLRGIPPALCDHTPRPLFDSRRRSCCYTTFGAAVGSTASIYTTSARAQGMLAC
ncbi:hypothetical protein AURDEDRAFT_111735 [Auricularia subglabra TFB-10046 SS5]|nr:hypothetical protein AURDEDRAFT_111735 [Auricularia subglabra TFB-10046 SS5]